MAASGLILVVIAAYLAIGVGVLWAIPAFAVVAPSAATSPIPAVTATGIVQRIRRVSMR